MRNKNRRKLLSGNYVRELEFKQKLKGTLEIRRLQRDSTNVNGNYEENAVTLYLLLGF